MIFSSFLPDFSPQCLSLHLPKLFSITPNLFPMCFSALRSFLHLVWSCFLYSYHAFHFFLHNFWDFLKNLGFFKIDEFSTNFWVGFCLNDFKCSCIPLHLHFNHIFMHYRCVLYMLNCCVLLGLDWANPMMLLMLYITC